MMPGIDYPGVCVTFFCHDGNGNVVMHLRSAQARDEQGLWDIGGGSLKLYQKLEDAVRSEVEEEYGADVISFELLGFRDVFRTIEGQKTHWVAFDFKVLVDPQQVKNGEPHKFTEVRWYTRTTLPPDVEMHSELPRILNTYADRLWV